MATQRTGTTPETKTATTEVTGSATTATQGSIEEVLQEKIKEYEKSFEDFKFKVATLEATQDVIKIEYEKLQKENGDLKAKIANQTTEIEALKTIKDTQDQALSSVVSDPATKEENLRFKLAKEGLTLVVIGGKNYSTGNATLQGVPVNDLSDEVKQELLEGGTFFTEL